MYVHVQHAQHPSDREQVYRFRYRVLVEELQQVIPSADHKRRLIRDELDDTARLLVALDEQSGAIVGTVRSNFGRDRMLPQAMVDELQLGAMVAALDHARISHTSGFVVDPAYRGETVASTLVTRLYSLALAKQVLVDTIACDPLLAQSCHQMGYRPYADAISRSDGKEPRHPLALVLRDGGYLAKVRSPLAKVTYLPPGSGEKTTQRLASLYPLFQEQEVVPQKPDSFWAGLAHVNAPAAPPPLFEGIDLAQVEPFLAELPVLVLGTDQCLADVVQEPFGMGVVLSGRLGLTVGQEPRPFFVSVLQAGEVFGQMAGFAATGRDPTLVALEDCEIRLLPADLPDRLATRAPAQAQKLRANLAAILVARLELMNRQVAGFMAGSPEHITPEVEPPVQPDQESEAQPTAPEPPVGEPVLRPPEARPDTEFPADLLAPAKALSSLLPADAEARWLKRVGLRDVSTILVMGDGSGEGILRLARTLPRTRVVGALPPELMATIQQRVDEAKVTDRCTLIPMVGERVPLADGTVDHAWLRFAFQRGADPSALMVEVRRLLRPGGVVAAQGLDDGGIMLQPEPPTLQAFLERVHALQGSRRIGRRLCHLLVQAGLERPRALVLPLVPPTITTADLIMSTFRPMAERLWALGAWTDADAELMATIRSVAERDDAWLCVPVICAAARAPWQED